MNNNKDNEGRKENLEQELISHKKKIQELEKKLSTCQERESFYCFLIENTPDIIAKISIDGTILYVTPPVFKLLGYLPEEVIGKKVSLYIPSDEYNETLNLIGKSIKNGENQYHIEHRMFHKNNKIIWVDVYGHLLFDEEKKLTEIHCQIREITQRKEAEHLLRIQHNLALALSSAKDLLTAANYIMNILITTENIDCCGVYLFNEKKCQLNLLAHKNLPDKFINNIVYYDNHIDRINLLMKGKPIYLNYIELQIDSPLSQEGLRSVAIIPIKHQDKIIASLNLASHKYDSISENTCKILETTATLIGDTIARINAEKLLAENIAMLSGVISNVPVVLFATDHNGIFTLSEGHGLALLGLKPGQVVGSSVFEVYKNIPDIIEHIKRALSGEEIKSCIDVQGITFQAWYAPVKDINGNITGVIGIGADVSDRKKNEELQAQLFQAQKMESIGRLAGGIAHDFNNMLSVIIGHADLISLQIDPNSSIYENISEIRKAAEHSAALTQQLLAFARKQIINPKIIDINEVVFGMQKMLKRLIGENIELLWKPSPILWKVYIDPVQIDQILANLIVNARDAIIKSGTIIIETENVVLDNLYQNRQLDFVPGEYVMIAVSDTGVGIGKEAMSHIFEPFFTTKDLGKGTGLGLSTVYGIVHQNKGFINIYSELNQGTTFKIYLPRALKEEENLKQKNIIEQSFLVGTETILFVEDEISILNLGKTILKKYGYTVLATSNPIESISIAKNWPGEIHLLLSDVVMPKMNGKEIKEKIESIRPNIKYLFMSGYTANVISEHGILCENLNFIEKPFSPILLIKKIRSVLDKK